VIPNACGSEDNETRLKLVLQTPEIQNIIRTEAGEAEFSVGKTGSQLENLYGIFLVEKPAGING